MLIESEYLKRQIKSMEQIVEKNDPGDSSVSHHAWSMVTATLNCISATIEAIEKHSTIDVDIRLLEDSGFEL